MMKNLRIVFFGTPEFITPVIEDLNNSYDLVGIVTTQDQKVGRKQEITPSPAALIAQKLDISCLKPESLDKNFIQEVKKLKPDLIVVAAFGRIIPNSILEIPKYGNLNIHPSKLPKYRGASPIQTALLNGDPLSGVSIIKMDEQMDHGPIITFEETQIQGNDNFETLSKKMFVQAARLLVRVMPDYIEGKINPQIQNDSEASFCKIIKKEDGYFPIDNPPPSEVLGRMIRAYYPWPTVWTRWNNQIVKLYPNRVIQLEGRKPNDFEAFLRGHPNFPIKSLL